MLKAVITIRIRYLLLVMVMLLALPMVFASYSDTGDIGFNGNVNANGNAITVGGWNSSNAGDYTYSNVANYDGVLGISSNNDAHDTDLLYLPNFERITYKLKVVDAVSNNIQNLPFGLHRDFGGPSIIGAALVSNTNFACYDTTVNYHDTGIPILVGEWHDIEINKTTGAATFKAYINGTDIGCTWSEANAYEGYESYASNGVYIRTYMDNFNFSNYSEMPLPSSTVNTINVTILTPNSSIIFGSSNFTDMGSRFWINTSFNLSSAACVINDTEFTLNSYNTTTELDGYNKVYFLNNTPLLSNTYNYLVSCEDPLDLSLNGSDTVYFTIDTQNPIITPAESLRLNKTNVYNGTLSTNIQFTDENEIYSINVSFGNGTGIYYGSNLGVTTQTVNIHQLVNEDALGNITARVCDAHTATEISAVQRIETTSKTLKYVIEDKPLLSKDRWVSIYPKLSSEYLNTPTTDKRMDRYTFTFSKTTKPEATETFIVESTEKIEIAKLQKYQGHLIIPSLNRWIDFENDESTKTEVKQITDYKVEVTIYDLKSKTITFNSIGELNCVESTYYYGNLNPVERYEGTVFIGSLTYFYLNITTNPITSNSLNATLRYNNTDYTVLSTPNFTQAVNAPSEVVGDSDDITFFWNLTYGGQNYNLTRRTQTVANMFLDTCTTYSMQTLNLTLRNEELDNYVNGSILVTFFLSSAGTPTEKNFSFNLSKNYAYYPICMFPNASSYQLSATMEYTAPSYEVRHYYLLNVTLTNVSQTINLYQVNDTVGDRVFIYVKDKNDNPQPQVYIRALRYYPDSNIFKTVEVGKTNDDGQAMLYLIPYDKFYKFIVINDRETILYESIMDRISQANYYFYIGEGSTWLSNYKRINGVLHNLNFNNVTQNVTYSFTDPSGLATRGCLKVVKTGIYGDTVLYNQCVSSTSGTLYYQIGENITNNRYLAKAYIDLPGNSLVPIDTKEIYQVGARVFGNQEIWLGIIMTMTLVFVGSFNLVIAIILMLVGLSILTMIGLFTIGLTSGLISLIIVGFILMFKVEK